ncbi:MAG TPA: hypothetical protein VFV85_01830 [Conexibacter sp.]|nr:hypothetical protein [Conexibacter sp.]
MRPAGALRTAEVAWLAVLPCALATAALVALLGPPLGHALLQPGAESFWADAGTHPEPAEHGRYVLSLLGPAALAAVVLASTRWTPRLRDGAARRLVLGTQLALVAFVVVCFAAQYDVVVSAYRPLWERTRYFTLPTLALALVVPPLAVALLGRRRGLAEGLARLARETRARRVAALLAAVLLTAAWLLTAVDADGLIANTASGVAGHVLWSMDEPFAILDGRTPLVDFHSQYGQLWPYVAAATMAVFGASIGTFTITMVTGSGLALLAIYAVLRRIARSSLAALALYLPFLATGFSMKLGPLDDRYGPANLFSLWPIRYGGPYVLAWLLARHLDGLAPRRRWPLFALAGLVAVNNPEFGLGALGALAVVLVALRPPRSRAAAARLLAEAAGGLLGAVALVSLGTLARSGSLPHLGWALEFSRLYGVGGWALLPMPRIGIFLVVYVTFAAAIAVAAVRLVRGASDVVLTGMLAWSGVFGLVAGAYFAGRSHPQVLIDLFSPWALSLVLLTVVAVRALAARGWRAPRPAELLVLCGFGLLACALAQTPTPWGQLGRIRDLSPAPVFRQHAAVELVREQTRPHEPIAILIPLGHRVAYDAGRTNVAPYASIESMPTRQQLARTLAVLRRAGGRRLFVDGAFTYPEELAAIERAGFRVSAEATDERGATISELIGPPPAPRPRR